MNKIGKITGIHGLKGEITFAHQLKPSTRFDTWDCILIELNANSFIPFFIETIKPISGNECICKFEEIHHREDAKKIISKSIFASPNYEIQEDLQFSFATYIGYNCFCNESFIGIMVDTIESSKNDMLIIEHEGKEILVPANHDFIVHTNLEKRELFFNLPEGLLDL
jgi:16S rRNA processing protein RimM